MIKTKKEIIDETVAYYCEDVSRRALRSGNCCYITDDGRMCAVGRCLTQEGLEQYNNCTFGYNNEMLPYLKEEYQIDDDYFWEDLQYLHDKKWYWDDIGLTKQGEEYVELLHSKYD